MNTTQTQPASKPQPVSFDAFMGGGEVKPVAAATGIQIQRVGQIRSGRAVPTANEINTIADVCAVPRDVVAKKLLDAVELQVKAARENRSIPVKQGRPRKA